MSSYRLVIIALLLSHVVACGANLHTHGGDPDSSTALIKLNQLGFLPKASKIAIIPSVSSGTFELRAEGSDTVVYRGELSEPKIWVPAGGERFKVADFTTFNAVGTYRLFVGGIKPSSPFVIDEGVYARVHAASIKAYYFNRAGLALEKRHAGVWARAAGHSDTNVKVHALASTPQKPSGTMVSSPQGWYDAGDFGKYIVNSAIASYTLLHSLSDLPDYYASLDLNIPESGDAIPDLLDEILWNVDWMLSMQDEDDGGVYHKLTALGFSGVMMPDEDQSQRYLIQKSTAATLDFAATLAVASRVVAKYEQHLPGLASRYKDAALKAWAWAQEHPEIIYRQGAHTDVTTGEYGDSHLQDEKSWAAAELFLLTGEQVFYDAFRREDSVNAEASWANVGVLAHFSIINSSSKFITEKHREYSEQIVVLLAEKFVDQHSSSAYQTAMTSKDFQWGSNSIMLNKAWVLMEAFKINGNTQYRIAAQGLVDFVLGKNPTDYIFVTGFGKKPPMFIHHRVSEADSIEQPVPGFVAGGPQPGQQDGCVYSSNAPAASYVDDWCSYASNEVAINWNAPFVTVIASMMVRQH